MAFNINKAEKIEKKTKRDTYATELAKPDRADIAPKPEPKKAKPKPKSNGFQIDKIPDAPFPLEGIHPTMYTHCNVCDTERAHRRHEGRIQCIECKSITSC